MMYEQISVFYPCGHLQDCSILPFVLHYKGDSVKVLQTFNLPLLFSWLWIFNLWMFFLFLKPSQNLKRRRFFMWQVDVKFMRRVGEMCQKGNFSIFISAVVLTIIRFIRFKLCRAVFITVWRKRIWWKLAVSLLGPEGTQGNKYINGKHKCGNTQIY